MLKVVAILLLISSFFGYMFLTNQITPEDFLNNLKINTTEVKPDDDFDFIEWLREIPVRDIFDMIAGGIKGIVTWLAKLLNGIVAWIVHRVNPSAEIPPYIGPFLTLLLLGILVYKNWQDLVMWGQHIIFWILIIITSLVAVVFILSLLGIIK